MDHLDSYFTFKNTTVFEKLYFFVGKTVRVNIYTLFHKKLGCSVLKNATVLRHFWKMRLSKLILLTVVGTADSGNIDIDQT